jgi:predicted nuclease of predicted toxin-antitoxin system
MTKDAPTEAALFVRLLCDVMIPAELAEALRAQGYDVAEARLLPVEVQQDDDAILQEASRQERVVVTCNYSDPQSNFCVIHEQWQSQTKEHAGIILVSQQQISSRSRRWEVRDRLLKFLNSYSADEVRNQLWWLPHD